RNDKVMPTNIEKTFLNFMNGRWVPSSNKEVITNSNPANTNHIIGAFQKSSLEDLNIAVTAAKTAKQSWKKLSGDERGKYLYKVADILENRLEDIAETLTLEMGKTYQE